MHWQEVVALSIVVATVALFAWQRVRAKSRKGLPGCGSCASSSAKPPSVILRAKKGERPQMIVKIK